MSEYKVTPEQLQKWREEFEEKFPMPNGLQRCVDDGRYYLYAPIWKDAETIDAHAYSWMYRAFKAARTINAQRIAELEAQIEILKSGLEVIRGAAKNAANFGDLQFVAAASLNKFESLAADKRKGK